MVDLVIGAAVEEIVKMRIPHKAESFGLTEHRLVRLAPEHLSGVLEILRDGFPEVEPYYLTGERRGEEAEWSIVFGHSTSADRLILRSSVKIKSKPFEADDVAVAPSSAVTFPVLRLYEEALEREGWIRFEGGRTPPSRSVFRVVDVFGPIIPANAPLEELP